MSDSKELIPDFDAVYLNPQSCSPGAKSVGRVMKETVIEKRYA